MNDNDRLTKKCSDGGFSYLYWPCSVDYADGKDLHVTAKFLGKQSVTKEQILQLIGGIPQDVSPSAIHWVADEFDTKQDGKVKVLRFTKFPADMQRIHDALVGLRVDDYPEYQPHITCSESIWTLVKVNGWQPKEMGLAIGGLAMESQNVVSYLA